MAQGLLSLDADVNEYLTSWSLPAAGMAPVTLRHLLCHSGALAVSAVPGYEQGQALPGLVEILVGVPPASSARSCLSPQYMRRRRRRAVP